MPTTYDYEQEQQRLQQQQAMLQALQQQAMQSTPMPQLGAQASRMSPFQPMVQALQAYLVKQGQGKLDDERKALTQRYKDDLTTGMQNFIKTSQGGETITRIEPGPDGRELIFQEPSKPDMRKAIMEALASNHPMVQQMAMAQLGQLGKDALSKKDILSLSGFDPKSKVMAALSGDINGLSPEVKEHVINGQLVSGTPGGAYKPVGDFRDTFGPVESLGRGASGPIFGQKNKSTGEAKFAPAGTSVKVDVTNKGEGALMSKLGESTAELVDKARKGKQMAQGMIYAADRLESLDKQGVFAGPTANIATTLGAFADSVGIQVDKEKLGRSEQYNAVLAQQVAKVLTDGSVGRSMTDEDRKRFEAQFPQLINSEGGRKQIIGMLRASAAQDMQYANSVEENLKQNFPDAARLFNVAPSKVPFPAYTPSAAAPAPAAGSVMSWEEYQEFLKKRGK